MSDQLPLIGQTRRPAMPEMDRSYDEPICMTADQDIRTQALLYVGMIYRGAGYTATRTDTWRLIQAAEQYIRTGQTPADTQEGE